MTTGTIIKEFRKQKNLSQKELGELCTPPIAESTIRRYELGKLNPKIETVKKISAALEVPLYRFYPNDNTSTPVEIMIEPQNSTLADEQLQRILHYSAKLNSNGLAELELLLKNLTKNEAYLK